MCCYCLTCGSTTWEPSGWSCVGAACWPAAFAQSWPNTTAWSSIGPCSAWQILSSAAPYWSECPALAPRIPIDHRFTQLFRLCCRQFQRLVAASPRPGRTSQRFGSGWPTSSEPPARVIAVGILASSAHRFAADKRPTTAFLSGPCALRSCCAPADILEARGPWAWIDWLGGWGPHASRSTPPPSWIRTWQLSSTSPASPRYLADQIARAIRGWADEACSWCLAHDFGHLA